MLREVSLEHFDSGERSQYEEHDSFGKIQEELSSSLDEKSTSKFTKMILSRIKHTYQEIYIFSIVILILTYFLGKQIVAVSQYIW